MYDPTTDPSLKDIIDDVAVNRYMRNELEYFSDLTYQGPFGGGYPPPSSFRGDWMSVLWDRSETARAPVDDRSTDSRPAVQRVMEADDDLAVYIACGYFDLVCSYAVIDHMVTEIEPPLAERITVRTYAGGHAIYTDEDARRQMRTDVTAFIESRLGDRPR
jgi:carboxypeptidase C (cathepsin A)